MSKSLIGHTIIQLDSIDSTNNYALIEFKEGRISSGTIIQAKVQTEGKGQRGKKWSSEPYANLILSIVADLKQWNIKNIISLNHITALAIQRFLSQYTDKVKIKWPNDIMINGKKVAGILIENQLSSQQQKSVIGIGININQTSFPIDRATSLYLETDEIYQPKELVFELIESYRGVLNEYHTKGEECIFNSFNENLWKRREMHRFFIADEEFEGEVVTTTMQGQLVVEVENELNLFLNGEVSY